MTLILLLKLLGSKKEQESSLLGHPSWPQGPHVRPPFPEEEKGFRLC